MSEKDTNNSIDLALNSLRQFVHMESFAGLLLVFSSIIALILANSHWRELYDLLIESIFYVGLNELEIRKPLLLWINDGLMAIFFLLIGLEIKREIFEGQLSNLSQIVLPGVGALGGIIAPALLFVYFNRDSSNALSGWAIPTATDIAFALGILALLGKRVPNSLKIFLMTLAIFDDVAAILIIAVFYSSDLSILSLTLAGLAVSILILLNRFKVKALSPYVFVGIILWVFVLKSGVHATVAGIILAFTIPLNGQGSMPSPLKTMEHRLHQWVTFMILPLFAFANAGVDLAGVTTDMLLSPVVLGVTLGLFLGKQLGIFSLAYLVIKLKWAKMPADANLGQLYGISVLCGVGFTMSLFISSLAYGESSFSTVSRLGILLGSLLSAVVGLLLLHVFSRKTVKSLE
jgi:Na+:H+ antiporter, NhaA family